MRIVRADGRAARKLDREIGEKVIYIRRLLSVDGKPEFYHREYLVYDPTRPIVEAETEVTALRGLFDGTGSAMLKRGELNIEACMLNDHEARLLHKTLPVAAFNLEHVFYDFDDRPVSWGWFICPSDYLKFSTSVGISEE